MDQIVSDFIELSEEKKITPAQTKVLQAAVQLFSDNGYDSTSTAAVAKAAGVSQAVIFKYFKNKEGLLDQILNLAIDNLLPKYGSDFVEKIQAEVGQDSFEDFLDFILRDRLAFIRANQNILMILVAQLMIDNRLVEKLEQGLRDKFWLVTLVLEKAAGPESKLSGQDILRLIASQLLLIFLEETRMNIHLSETAANQRIKQVRQMILAAVYQTN